LSGLGDVLSPPRNAASKRSCASFSVYSSLFLSAMPIAIVEFAKIDAELTKRLGQIAINWAVIEEWLGHMLGTLIDADLGGANVLTSEMGAASVIKAIKNCIAINEPKQPELSAVRELIEEADELRQERNLYIHGVWEPNTEAGTALIQTTGWQRAEIIRSRLITTADLDHLLADFDDFMLRFVELGIRFGFPRKRGEPLSIFLS
jgi:hypothetical protein